MLILLFYTIHMCIYIYPQLTNVGIDFGAVALFAVLFKLDGGMQVVVGAFELAPSYDDGGFVVVPGEVVGVVVDALTCQEAALVIDDQSALWPAWMSSSSNRPPPTAPYWPVGGSAEGAA